MSITLDQLDKIVHKLNNDLHNGYDFPPEYGLVGIDSSGYTYCISIGDYALYDAELHSLPEDVEEVYAIELHCRNRLIDFCNFWAKARERIYMPTKDRRPIPVLGDENEESEYGSSNLWDRLGETFDHELDG